MFINTRRTFAGLIAAAALAGAAGVAGVAPQAASASNQCTWQVPATFDIQHGNGWEVTTYQRQSFNVWTVIAGSNRDNHIVYGTMKITRWDVGGPNPQVRFTIALNNRSTGLYVGSIDPDGFISGFATDRINGGRTRFVVSDTVDCA